MKLLRESTTFDTIDPAKIINHWNPVDISPNALDPWDLVGTDYTRFALVIGITEYSTAHDLYYTDDDADDWAKLLEKHGYCVIKLTGYVTKSDIDEAFSILLGREDEGNYVAIIYSGHGIYLSQESTSAILTSDGYYLTESYFEEINEQLDSNHVFWFFDACEIGGMATLGIPGRYVAMASDKEHYSYEDPFLGNGVFTYYFLQAIEEGYYYMEQAFDHAYYKCKCDPKWGTKMFPIEADGDPSEYFALWPISSSNSGNENNENSSGGNSSGGGLGGGERILYEIY